MLLWLDGISPAALQDNFFINRRSCNGVQREGKQGEAKRVRARNDWMAQSAASNFTLANTRRRFDLARLRPPARHAFPALLEGVWLSTELHPSSSAGGTDTDMRDRN